VIVLAGIGLVLPTVLPLVLWKMPIPLLTLIGVLWIAITMGKWMTVLSCLFVSGGTASMFALLILETVFALQQNGRVHILMILTLTILMLPYGGFI
jgi:hypothetical protein